MVEATIVRPARLMAVNTVLIEVVEAIDTVSPPGSFRLYGYGSRIISGQDISEVNQAFF